MIRILRLGLTAMAVTLLAACGGAGDSAEEQPADTAMVAAPATPDLTGTWNMRSVPVSGDTTPTIFQAQIAGGNWTLLLPGRDPISATVAMDGDSIIVDAGPYESVRRAGVQVTTHSVYRVQGDQLVGTTMARYQGATADSLVLNSTGTRAQ